jgi:hypothetical protein
VPCSATHRQKLQTVLDAHGMGDLMPEPTTPMAALRAAMTENYPAPNTKVRHGCFPHKNGSDGYKIGAHDPKANVRVAEQFCEAVAIGTLRTRYLPLKEGQKKPETEWTGEIKLDPWDGDKERSILGYMRHLMEVVPAGKLRDTVTDLVERCGGRRLIEDQPLLWITADAIPRFKRIKTEIEAASAETDHHGASIEPTRISVLSVLADEEMAREVISMLMGVVQKETVRVERRLAQESLTMEQAGNDIMKAMELYDELDRYAEMLNQPLTDIKVKARDLQTSIANKSLEKAALGL